MADKNLEILIKTIADTGAVDEVKAKIDELKASTDANAKAWKDVSASLGKSESDVKAYASALAKATDDSAAGLTKLASIAGVGIGSAIAGLFAATVQSLREFEQEEERAFEDMEKSRQKVIDMQTDILALQDAMISEARLGTEPLEQSISRLRQEIIRVRTEQGLLNLSTEEGLKSWKALEEEAKKLGVELGVLNNISRERQALLDKEAVTKAQAFGSQDEIAKAEWGARYNQLLEQRKKLGLDISAGTLNELIYEEQLAKDKQASLDSTHSLSASLREQATILQGLRQQQQLIASSPFLGADQRSQLTLESYNRELLTLQQELSRLQTLKSGPLDEAQLALVNQRIQQTVFYIDELKQKMLALQQPLRTELASWINSFGTVSHQIAGLIEGTINASLQQFNQLILTGKFNTQDLVQSIGQIALTFIEQLVLMKAAQLLHITTTTSAVVASNIAISTSAAPAAAAESVATGGAAAFSGQSAALAAFAAIIGALKFHTGGIIPRRMHSGGLAHDEIPIIAQEGEFMIQRDVAQQILPFLMALNSGALFHVGGLIPFVPGGRYHGGSNGGIKEGGPGWDQVVQLLMEPGALNQNVREGPIVETPTDRSGRDSYRDVYERGGFDYDREFVLDNFMSRLLGQGFLPNQGSAAFGPTVIPTQWINYPGVGAVPMAVPVSYGVTVQDSPASQDYPSVHPKHSGGPIGRLNLGASRLSVPSFSRRFHSGGGVSRSSGGSMRGMAPVIHVYPVMQPNEIVKHMASQQGSKVIFDVINGRRIDLGFAK
jgi:hypothetical protein